MKPSFVIAGKIHREYILPPAGYPIVDAQGGNVLYAAGGLAVWRSQAGLIALGGNDYPQDELDTLASIGFDMRGIRGSALPNGFTFVHCLYRT
ncbi:MAG: hypothetical protein U0Z26_10695 [Anaerolineales bacterium]